MATKTEKLLAQNLYNHKQDHENYVKKRALEASNYINKNQYKIIKYILQVSKKGYTKIFINTNKWYSSLLSYKDIRHRDRKLYLDTISRNIKLINKIPSLVIKIHRDNGVCYYGNLTLSWRSYEFQ